MRDKIVTELSECQAGYRQDRGTADMLFILQILIEKINETNEEAIITFIDYSKAFDSVEHNHLFKTMIDMGFPKHIVHLLQTLYDDQHATIRWNNENCVPFKIEKGVRQGCILSPHLFSIYTEQVMRDADIEGLGVNIGGHNITDLRYADDTAILSNSFDSMKHLLSKIDEAGKTAGLQLNAKKTKVMTIGTQMNPNILVNGTALEQVEQFKYLGSIKTNNGNCTTDIRSRITMAKQKMLQLNNVWKDRAISKKLKVKLLKALIWPICLYGSEAWTTKKKDEIMIDAAEMWFYRRILRVSYKERRTNQSILKELGTNLELVKEVQKRKLGYLGHSIRNRKCKLMKNVVQGKVQGKRKRGRPTLSYMDGLKKKTNESATALYRIAEDREQWRQLIWRTSLSATAKTGVAAR